MVSGRWIIVLSYTDSRAVAEFFHMEGFKGPWFGRIAIELVDFAAREVKC